MYKLLSHGRISHECSRKYSPRCLLKARKGVISGYSSSVTIVEIISLSTDNLDRVDHMAPVYLFVTGIMALDTHSSLLLIEEIVLAFCEKKESWPSSVIENCHKWRGAHET